MIEQDPPVSLSYSSVDTGLTRQDAALIALRLTGAYALFQAMPLAGAATYFWGSGTFTGVQPLQLVAACIPYGIYLLLGLALLFRAGWFLKWLIPETPSGVSLPPINPVGHDLQAMAFAVVGVLFMLWSVEDVINGLLDLWIAKGVSLNQQSLIGASVQMLLGVALFLRARGLSHFWHRIRTAGVRQHPPESSPPPSFRE